MDETTTDAATQDEALIDPTVEAQPPVAEQPAEAANTDSEPNTPDDPSGDENPEEAPASADTADEEDELTDEQVLEWADKKGFDLSTPEGQAKALRSIRTAEKKMHQATTQASELASQVGKTDPDPDATEAQKALHIATQLQNAEVIRTWKAANNISAAEDKAMGEYAKENPQARQLLTNGLITLDQFRAMAGASKPVDEAAIKAAGKKEALESMASKQGASSVASAAASNASAASKTDEIADVWADD